MDILLVGILHNTGGSSVTRKREFQKLKHLLFPKINWKDVHFFKILTYLKYDTFSACI
jgi:hypothetical protein